MKCSRSCSNTLLVVAMANLATVWGTTVQYVLSLHKKHCDGGCIHVVPPSSPAPQCGGVAIVMDTVHMRTCS